MEEGQGGLGRAGPHDDKEAVIYARLEEQRCHLGRPSRGFSNPLEPRPSSQVITNMHAGPYSGLRASMDTVRAYTLPKVLR